ncbi:MAG TPA: endonuclease III [Accumulibacter sp.]|uniref:endonuclease III n=1 Tax=Accumulibacter sp. TaxID=2053492 RepID=UPI000EBA89C9|nr:endonuclease III [Accumulibacter sp.]HCZ16544.1 endonuclease III [Accumulibacter sp.]HRF71350.1 endonuclease III [Accumulibacter sp.]
MNRNQCYELFARLRSANPQPTTELEYASNFQLLIAVILSAQATDKSVNLATRKLFADAPTPQAMLALGEERLSGYINRIGLYRNKARNVIATCRQLLELHGGDVPPSRSALEALPGVGRKTANVVLNTAFGEATIAVDTHIFRVARRTGLAVGTTPLAVERELLELVPGEFRQSAHHWLILHGRYVCTARKPECWRCSIADLCAYPEKTVAFGLMPG